MKFCVVTLLIIVSANLAALAVSHYTGWDSARVLSAIYAGVVGSLYGELLRERGER